MRLNEDIDFTTLTWVKPELDETLRQARQALEAYVEEGEDPGQLTACATFLHQVQGTLRMVELYGAAMVAEEMEHLAKALHEGRVADRDVGYAALMRGIVQLPDYLERLQSGHRDIPIVLLPLLNELREPRGEKGLSESVLFSPDLSRPLPRSAAGPDAPLPADQLKRRAETLRGLFQSALLRWLKDDNSPSTIRDLTDVCEQLVPITDAEHARRLFWVAAGTLDALAKGAFEASKPLKQALGKVEREIKRLAEGGDAAFRSDPPLELTRQLLYFVAHAPTEHGRIGEIRTVFGLGEYLPSESELAHARGSLSGRNRALLSTVAAAIKEDLLRVKDALDLHLRTPESAAASLGDQVEALDRVADTLGMLGLGMPRRVVQDQRNAIHAIVSGQRIADEAGLLDIAGALLYVEASLDDQVSRLGEAEAPGAAAPAAAEPTLPGSEARKVLEVLVKEAIANFAQARQCFVAFVETHWDHAQLADVPRLLEEVSGALRILELQDAPMYLAAVRRFTENELLRRHRVPNGQQMDRLADTLAGLEYYLEALRDRRPKREQILDIARQNLEALGYWPLPPEEPLPARVEAAIPVAAAPVAAAPAPVAMPAPLPEPSPEPEPLPAPEPEPVPQPSAEQIPGPSFDFGQPADIAASLSALPGEPVAPPVAAPAPVFEPQPEPELASAPALPVVPGFDGASDEIDDEIREVFLEEFQEEIGNLEQLLPAWRTKPDNLEQLRPIRRVFHTLKGSGRLVGAKALGEFSWKVESMLNRVLDGTRPATPAVVGLIEQAFNTLPLLRAALQGETVHADLHGVEQLADRIAAGEDAFYVPPAAAGAAAAAPVAAPVAAPAHEPEPAIGPFPDLPAMQHEAPEPVAEGGSGHAIDPVLFEILKPEVAGHLETLDAWLAACAAMPQPVNDPLLRAVHTMNGAFAMTEVTVLTDVTAPLEGYMKRSLALHHVPTTEGVAVVADAVAAIREAMATLENPRAALADYHALAQRIQALRDALPEPSQVHVPAHPEETDAVMPAAVMLDAPDLSALPSFDAAPAAPAPEAVEPALDVAGIEGFDAALEIPADEPAPESISLEAFLVEEAAADVPGFTISEAEPEAPVVDALADAAELAAAEAAAAEAAAAEAAAAERAAAEIAAAEAAAAEAAAAEAAAAEAAAAEAAAAEAAAAEAAAAEAAAAEAAAAEAATTEDNYGLSIEELEALTAPEAAAGVPAEPAPATVADAAPEAAPQAQPEPEPAPADADAQDAPEAPVAALLAASLVPLADDPADPDEALDTSELDEDLLDIFLEESGDLLDHSDGLLAGLRDNPGDREAVVGLQRDLHTLKGGARMAGIFAVGELGHAMESLLEAVAEGRRELDGTGVVVLERAFDRLHGMVTRVGERKALALPAQLIAQIDALARGKPLDAVAAPAAGKAAPAPERPAETALDRKAAAAEQAPVVRVAAPSATPGAGLAPLSAPIEGLGEEDDGSGVRAPQEQVRIRADLLDRLVNYAGEVAIYRARLEQQLGAFRSNLGELGQTTARLREQLRKLDIETEAQIIARYQREGEQGSEEFDPLELDRFTTQQQLSRSLAESANDLASLHVSLDDLVRQYETLLLQQSRVSSDLQEGLMRTRMVPFDALVPRLRRVLRQSGSETGKQVNLKVDGASGEMDRNVLDRMTAPLEHMLRNAVAHGLESPADRRKAKKPEEGTVRIQVLREGSEVVLRVSDDGRGLDKEAIRRKAIERGLLKADAEVPDQALYGFILETGFSTAKEVSRLAGRGVGMDVVYSEIRQLGGSLSIESEQGKGSTFTVRLPFTLAVTQAVFVKIGDTSFAVPIASVQGVGRIGRAELEKQLASDAPSFSYAGEPYAIHDLGRLIGHSPAKAQDSLQMPLLLARSGDLRAAICVDQVLGSKEIVVKPVGPQVNSIPGIFGATIMGDGRVVVILDVAPLVRRQASLARDVEATAPVPVQAHRVPVVMVVDDSITMRKVTGRVLERHNFEVMTAKDGVDAIEKMAERVPDLMLLDIEMPRMDGYELAQNMKSDPRLKDVPIVMITSRTGEKHRQRAFDIGVNRYLGKPYQEVELMRNVFEMLGMEPVNG